MREVEEKAEADAKRTVRDNFLALSQFLRLAAARRAEEADPTLDENMALEGVLLAVYGGDEHAVSTMIKLVEGSDEKTVGTAGEQLESTCKFPISSCTSVTGGFTDRFVDGHIKSVAQTFLAPYDVAEEAEAKPAEPEVKPELKSAEEAAPAEQVNGETVEASAKVNGVTPAAEAPAEEAVSPSNDLSTSQEWVSVSRPEEPAAVPDLTPAASQSWADDHPETTAEVRLIPQS